MRSSTIARKTGLEFLTGIASRRMVLGIALGAAVGAMSLAGCKSNSAANPADGTTADASATDPTAANMAPVDNSGGGTTQVQGYQQQAQPTQQSQTYSNPAPIVRQAPSSGSDSSNQGYSDQDYNADQGYDATLSDIQAPQPPPPLPEYAQPPAPDPNYIWTPGYWSYTPAGYYWVPGAWVQAPYTGALWTPGYWGGYGQGYRFHHGFWAAHIGFYGGINYGFGYVGVGYQGGYWNGPHFFYNQYANNINLNINPGFREAVYQHNVVVNNTVINNRVVNNTTYNNVTVNNTRINNVSYNGGRGGIQAQPRPAELAVLREQRVPPMQAQVQQAKVAAANPQQFYAHNQGRPAEAVAARPLAADRGIPAPPHTTAEINRAAPPQEQQRQHQEAFRQTVQPHPAAAPAEQNRPTPEQAQRPEGRPGVTQPNRPAQPEARPAPQANRPAQQTERAPQREAQPAARPAPQQTHPQQEARPQPEARPAPQARPQQEARPAPQARPQQQARPESRPQPEEHQKPEQKPEPHAQAAAAHPQAKPKPAAHPEHPEQHPDRPGQR